MSVSSSFEFILLQGSITTQLAPYLTLIDICRLTAVSKALRFKWPVKCNSVLNVLNKALLYFAWPYLPALNDELKNNSCEYNVFCSMIEHKCRIANLDLRHSGELFCIGRCGLRSMGKHELVGAYFSKFTICKFCSGTLTLRKWFVLESQTPGIHLNLLNKQWWSPVTEQSFVYQTFYKTVEAASVQVDGCLDSKCVVCKLFPISFIKKQVEKHGSAFTRK